MKHLIQIDGKEYDVRGLSEDRREIYTCAGTFFLSPVCFGHFGELRRRPSTGVPDQDLLMCGRFISDNAALPRPIPKSIRRVTFCEPDLPDCTGTEVSDHYRKNKTDVDEKYAELKQYCASHGKTPVKFVDFKKGKAKRAKLEHDFGFIEDGFTEVFLFQAFENQGAAHPEETLQSLKHEVSYPGGEIVYLKELDQFAGMPVEHQSKQNPSPLSSEENKEDLVVRDICRIMLPAGWKLRMSRRDLFDAAGWTEASIEDFESSGKLVSISDTSTVAGTRLDGKKSRGKKRWYDGCRAYKLFVEERKNIPSI